MSYPVSLEAILGTEIALLPKLLASGTLEIRSFFPAAFSKAHPLPRRGYRHDAVNVDLSCR